MLQSTYVLPPEGVFPTGPNASNSKSLSGATPAHGPQREPNEIPKRREIDLPRTNEPVEGHFGSHDEREQPTNSIGLHVVRPGTIPRLEQLDRTFEPRTHRFG